MITILKLDKNDQNLVAQTILLHQLNKGIGFYIHNDCWIAVDNTLPEKKVVGAAQYLLIEYPDSREIDIDFILVDPEYRGKNIGTLLTDKIVEEADLLGINCELENSIDQEGKRNHQYVDFYKKWGFLPISESCPELLTRKFIEWDRFKELFLENFNKNNKLPHSALDFLKINQIYNMITAQKYAYENPSSVINQTLLEINGMKKINEQNALNSNTIPDEFDELLLELSAIKSNEKYSPNKSQFWLSDKSNMGENQNMSTSEIGNLENKFI